MKKGMVKEVSKNCASGYMALLILVLLLVFTIWNFVIAIQDESVMRLLTVVLPCD